VPFDQLPTYTVRQLEARAGEYLARNFGPDVPIPVDIDLLVEREGIDLDEWPKLRTNHGIEGGVWRDTDSGQLFIFIAEELMADESPAGYGRYRMTVAEELAHIHLHRELIAQIDTPAKFRELQNHPQWAEVERDARWPMKIYERVEQAIHDGLTYLP
jgi:hypothetical protein